MRAKFMLIPVLATFGFSASVLAATPPINALSLSEIIHKVEAQYNPKYIDEVNWDNDGYWEVEYYDAKGKEIKIKIDPVTGEIRK